MGRKGNKKSLKNEGGKSASTNVEKAEPVEILEEETANITEVNEISIVKDEAAAEVNIKEEQNTESVQEEEKQQEVKQPGAENEDVQNVDEGNTLYTKSIPQASFESPSFQFDSVYPTHSQEEIDYYNDAADQLPTSAVRDTHRYLVPVNDTSAEETRNEDETNIDNMLENETNGSTTNEDANTSSKAYSITATAGTTVADTEEDINTLDNTSLPTIDQVYPQAILIAENEQIHIMNESAWQIIEDATIATIEGSLTAADSASIHIHYLGKDTKTHCYDDHAHHPTTTSQPSETQEHVLPMHPDSHIYEMNFIERVVILLGSIYQVMSQFISSTSSIVDKYEAGEISKQSTATAKEEDWKGLLLGLFGLEFVKKFLRLQMQIMVQVAQFCFTVTYSIGSWYIWWILLPFRTISRWVQWNVSVVTTILVMILQWLPGRKKIPMAVNGSSHHH